MGNPDQVHERQGRIYQGYLDGRYGDQQYPPVVSGIHLKNIRGRKNQGAVDVIGLPEQSMRDVTFEEVHFSPAAEVRVRDAEYEELK